jgi:hypothetical protein
MIAEGSRSSTTALSAAKRYWIVAILPLGLRFYSRLCEARFADGLVKTSELQMQNPAVRAGFADSTGVERRLPTDLLVLLLILVLIRKRRTKLRIDIDV